MNQYDVNMLDAAVHDGSHWMGCILCPSLDGDNSGEGKEASYNLLMREKVQFWKIKVNKNNLSRQSMKGIPIPTSVPAVPTEWNHVKKQLRLWALNGGCLIGSYSDKSKDDFMNKILQCTRCLPYSPRTPPQVVPLLYYWAALA